MNGNVVGNNRPDVQFDKHGVKLRQRPMLNPNDTDSFYEQT